MTKAKETHGLSKIMRARHESKTCDWGCPFCKREEAEAEKAEGLANHPLTAQQAAAFAESVLGKTELETED